MVSIKGIAFAVTAWQSTCIRHCRASYVPVLRSSRSCCLSTSSTKRWASESNTNKDASDAKAAPLPPSQPIVGYHLDEERHWVAELECGHNQHVRHDPPMVERPWVLTAEGRESFLGYRLSCLKCLSYEGNPEIEQDEATL